MTRKGAAAIGAMLIILSGCSKKDENANLATADTRIVDNIVVPDDETAAANNGAAPAQNAASPVAADNGRDIPPMLRGRWGMVPADCTSTHGDAKGLLEISSATLTFYESRGTLSTIEEHEPSRIRARFAFEGEGMSWNRDMTLDVQDSGQTLIRREYGEDAAPGPMRYRRCKG